MQYEDEVDVEDKKKRYQKKDTKTKTQKQMPKDTKDKDTKSSFPLFCT